MPLMRCTKETHSEVSVVPRIGGKELIPDFPSSASISSFSPWKMIWRLVLSFRLLR